MTANTSKRVNQTDKTEPIINESLISILLNIVYLFFKCVFKKLSLLWIRTSYLVWSYFFKDIILNYKLTQKKKKSNSKTSNNTDDGIRQKMADNSQACGKRSMGKRFGDALMDVVSQSVGTVLTLIFVSSIVLIIFGFIACWLLFSVLLGYGWAFTITAVLAACVASRLLKTKRKSKWLGSWLPTTLQDLTKITRLNDVIYRLCDNYVSKVAAKPEHRLRWIIPPKNSVNRPSSRLADKPM